MLLVENGTAEPAHVLAAGAGGVNVRVGDTLRFIRTADLATVELDADDGHVADAGGSPA